MKYLLEQDLFIKDKIYEAGSVVEASVIPQKSIKWLVEQGIIIKFDKKLEAEMLKKSAQEEE